MLESLASRVRPCRQKYEMTLLLCPSAVPCLNAPNLPVAIVVESQFAAAVTVASMTGKCKGESEWLFRRLFRQDSLQFRKCQVFLKRLAGSGLDLAEPILHIS